MKITAADEDKVKDKPYTITKGNRRETITEAPYRRHLLENDDWLSIFRDSIRILSSFVWDYFLSITIFV